MLNTKLAKEIKLEQQSWSEQHAVKHLNGRAFFAGTYQTVEAEPITRISPINGQILSHIDNCGHREIEACVSTARSVFQRGDWSNTEPSHRKKILLKFADLIEESIETLALINTLEMGKPISDSLGCDVPFAIDCLRWYAEAIDKINDEALPPRPNILATITREPLGVVSAITPWNFPLIVNAWKIAPALACGNSLILKPAEQSSLSAIYLAELAIQAGIPDGVFNVLPGLGEETGKMLASHNDIDAVFFTGSTEVGLKMLEYSGQSNMKKVGLECGGKGAFIVFNQCHHLEEAAEVLANNVFFNQGQICSAPTRLIIQREIKQEFLEYLSQHYARYAPANPLSMTTKMGAMIDRAHMQTVDSAVNRAQVEGAELIVGGLPPSPVEGGAYYQPTVLDRVHPDMSIAKQETFGPVLSVMTIDSEQDAINAANNTEYGLASAVWSDDLDQAMRVARVIRCGTVHINSYGEDDITAPFGGYKRSGLGKDKSIHALSEYSEQKTTWIKLRTL